MSKVQYDELQSLFEILYEDRERLKREAKDIHRSSHKIALEKVHLELLKKKVIQQENVIESLNDTIKRLKSRGFIPQPRNERTPNRNDSQRIPSRRNSMNQKKTSTFYTFKPKMCLKPKNIY